MKKIILFLILFGSQVFAQNVTSPVPNLSNEIELNKAVTYVYLYNPGPQPITTSLSIPSNAYGISLAINRCSTIKAKNTCYLVINFSSYKSNIPTTSVSLLNNLVLLTTLKYNANNIESISVNPTSLSFGTITTEGLTSTQTVTVQNTGTVSLSPIVSPSNSNVQISSNTCLSVIPPSNTCSFGVRYNAQSSTQNGVVSGLSVSVAPSSSTSATLIPISTTLDLPPVLIIASKGSVSSGGAVDVDRYVYIQGYSTKAYNSVSNIFYSWGTTYLGNYSSPNGVSLNTHLDGKKFKKIASSNTHSCAIATDDLAYCWGSIYSIGIDLALPRPNSERIPYPVKGDGVLAGKTIKSMGSGQYFSCAIASDDKVYCWGLNDSGQLGNNDLSVTGVFEPNPVYWSGALAGKTAKSLNVDQAQTCIIASDDLAYCWGYSKATNIASEAPTQIPMTGSLAGKTVKSLFTVGYTHCLLASDNLPYCWGSGASGQLPPGNIDSINPIPISMGAMAGKIVKEIYSNSVSMYALTEDDKVFSWGTDHAGSLGTNSSQYVTQEPTEIYMSDALLGKSIKSLYIAAEDIKACVIASDNLPYCWGTNSGTNFETLGVPFNFTQLNYSSKPLAVYTSGSLFGKQIKSLHIAPFQTVLSICALASDSNVYCWGNNSQGQLGNGSTTPSLVPVLAPTP